MKTFNNKNYGLKVTVDNHRITLECNNEHENLEEKYEDYGDDNIILGHAYRFILDAIAYDVAHRCDAECREAEACGEDDRVGHIWSWWNEYIAPEFAPTNDNDD